jgi:hypothetical protein
METHKVLRDLRGSQSRIGRLLSFSVEAYIHVLTYRIMIPLSLVYSGLILAYLLTGALGTGLKVFTAVIWALWTPQLFEVAKGLSLAWSRGMAFGHMNEEFAQMYRRRYNRKSGAYIAFPYVVLSLWAIGFVVILARWHP